jgi:PhzF family phenazine biosynthesis protein
LAAFTDAGRGGNPAGVVLAEALPEHAEMQAIAADVGYSETVFASRSGRGFTVRYFSPETEVPFCGHATIALGAVLGAEFGAATYQLSLATAEIEVEAQVRDGEAYSILRSPHTSHEPIATEIRQETLDLFGYSESDLDLSIPFVRAHGGANHLIVPLRTRESLARMDYDLGPGRSFMQRYGIVTVAFVVRDRPDLYHARNAFASGGVLEDPATGAAAAAFLGLLRDRGLLASGAATILQGEDMGRPSRIDAHLSSGVGDPVFIGGTSTVIG